MRDTWAERVGERLAVARRRKRLRQSDAARLAGIHTNTLSLYELGQRKIPAEVLVRLAELYELTVEKVIEGLEVPS